MLRNPRHQSLRVNKNRSVDESSMYGPSMLDENPNPMCSPDPSSGCMDGQYPAWLLNPIIARPSFSTAIVGLLVPMEGSVALYGDHPFGVCTPSSALCTVRQHAVW